MENQTPPAASVAATYLEIPARNHPFVAESNFVSGNKIGGLTIQMVNQSFQTALLPGATFDPYGSYGLAYILLDHDIRDGGVTYMFGGIRALETGVVSQWDVLEHHPNELVRFAGNEYSVFLVRGVDGRLYTAKVKVAGDKCCMLAFPYGEVLLPAGCRMFFPYQRGA